ncbi:cytochrome P450 [Streptomyces sp. RK76]
MSDLAEPDMEGHHHVAFGFGVHQCLGHNLARAELAVVPHTLFDRLPT